MNTIKDLIRKLRSLTVAVEITPFVYTAINIGVLVAYLNAPEPFLVFLDTLFYVSPLVTVILLVESRILELCRWHKAACALPLIPQSANVVDSFVVPFHLTTAAVFNVVIIVMCVLLLVAAYNVFFT